MERCHDMARPGARGLAFQPQRFPAMAIPDRRSYGHFFVFHPPVKLWNKRPKVLDDELNRAFPPLIAMDDDRIRIRVYRISCPPLDCRWIQLPMQRLEEKA